MLEIEYELIPEHMREGVRLYLEEGVEPGSFLRAALENNFVQVCAHADNINRERLFEWAEFLWNEMPGNVWGSPEKVRAWIDSRRKKADETRPAARQEETNDAFLECQDRMIRDARLDEVKP